MMVNRRAGMTCTMMAEQEMTIESHSKYPVIKDLIVDQPMASDDSAASTMDAA